MDDALELERAGWVALAHGGGDARAFYDDALADDVTMLLPGGMLLDDRRTILDAMSGPPWRWYELSDERTVVLATDAVVVAYRVRARRGDEAVYTALVTSTYRRSEEGRWLLVVHQQTPAPDPETTLNT